MWNSINRRECWSPYPAHPKARSTYYYQEKTLAKPKMALLKTLPVTDFSFDFYGEKPTDLIYQGGAHFPRDSTYLRLTETDSSGEPEKSSWGRVIYPEPVLLWRPHELANLETTVKFILDPKSSSDTPADGLVFFMVPMGYSFPPFQEGGDLGIYDGANSSPLLAVEVDIFANDWDPSFIHLGINTKTRDSQNVAQIPTSFIGKEVTLNITYAAATRVISAILTTGTQTVQASHECDLRKLIFPHNQQVQVGLSGATGGFVANHDVSYWKFHSELVHID